LSQKNWALGERLGGNGASYSKQKGGGKCSSWKEGVLSIRGKKGLNSKEVGEEGIHENPVSVEKRSYLRWKGRDTLTLEKEGAIHPRFLCKNSLFESLLKTNHLEGGRKKGSHHWERRGRIR